MEGRRNVQRNGACAQFLGLLDGAVHGGLVARDDDVAVVVVVGDDTDADFRAGLGRCFGQSQIRLRTDQRGHRALAHRHGALHGLTAQLQQAGRVRQADRPDRRQGRIFAQRVTGDKAGLGHVHAELDLQHPRRRRRDGHQGRLGVFGQGQLVFRAFAHQVEQLLVQRVVDLGEDVACAGEGLGESCAHADALAALTGEEKREGHRGTIRGPLIQGAEG
ncbi:hypothetical protein D3C80_1493080 [compost metagenome]